MATDKNIQDLANENKRLMAENAKLRQFVYEEIAYAMFIGNDYSKAEALARLKKMARELCAELGMEAPVIETPKPKFAVGDRVTVSKTGFAYEIHSIWLKDGEYIYSLFYGGSAEGCFARPENKLAASKPDLSFTAHDDATSHGCQMCGNDWQSLNAEGYCSSCWTVWKS